MKLTCMLLIHFGQACFLQPQYSFYSVDQPQKFVWGQFQTTELERRFFAPLPYQLDLQLTSRPDYSVPAAMQVAAAYRPSKPTPQKRQPKQRVEPPVEKPKPALKTEEHKFTFNPRPGERSSDQHVYGYVAATPGRGIGALIKKAVIVNPDVPEPSVGLKQLIAVHSAVRMNCFTKNARLMRALTKVRQHYGKQVQVTSGFRDLKYNTRVNGAKNSYHLRCAAADIAVNGVDKVSLRNYVRTLPEVGGVGIYSSGFVHIDTGPRRDWDWRAKRRKKKG